MPFLLRLGALKFSEAEILDLLQGAYGDQTVNVRFGNMADPGTYLNRREEEMPLRRFHWGKHFMQVNGAGTSYAAGTVIPAEMARDLGVPFFRCSTLSIFFNEPRMWMGKKGTVTCPCTRTSRTTSRFAYFGCQRMAALSASRLFRIST